MTRMIILGFFDLVNHIISALSEIVLSLAVILYMLCMSLQCRPQKHQSRNDIGNHLGKEKEDNQKKRTKEPS